MSNNYYTVYKVMSKIRMLKNYPALNDAQNNHIMHASNDKVT